MRCIVPLFVLTVAACSGGSGGFSPSPDLRTSHEYLRGGWAGTLFEDGGGAPRPVFADIGEGSRAAYFDVNATVEGLGVANGELQAGANRWRAAMSSPAAGSLQFDGVIVDQRRLSASWRGTGTTGALAGRSGTVRLQQVSAPVVWTQDVLELEDLTVVVQRCYR